MTGPIIEVFLHEIGPGLFDLLHSRSGAGMKTPRTSLPLT